MTKLKRLDQRSVKNPRILEIMKKHNLTLRWVEEQSVKNDYEYPDGFYKPMSVNEKTERAVTEWYKGIKENRCKLLSPTPHAHLYCNLDSNI